MSTEPRKPEPGNENGERTPGMDDDESMRDQKLDGPQSPGNVDPFQDPEYLAKQLPEDVEAQPGAEPTPGENEQEPDRRAAEDIEADGSGSDAPAEDGDRFDAG